MGIIRAFTGAISGTFADQWKDIITAGHFDEHTAVSPGILRQTSGRGSVNNATDGVISNGSRIYVPENTAAFIFSQSGIEDIITFPGGYEYQSSQASIFNGDGLSNSVIRQVKDRVGFSGQTADFKQIAFVNLREIRDIKFGTRGPLMYNDSFYGIDLEVLSFGSFTLKVIDAEKFIKNFVPANVTYYSFNDQKTRAQILAEFIQSFTVALNALSTTYRISQLPAQANEITTKISGDSSNAGTWMERFGFEIVSIAIENIEFSPESKEIVKLYSSKIIEAQGDAQRRALEGYTYNDERGFDVAEGVASNQAVGQMTNLGVGLGMVSGIGSTVGSTVGGIMQNTMNSSFNSSPQPKPATPNTAVCSKCGSPLQPNTKFCHECGQAVMNENEIICPFCGKKTHKGKFCAECGASLLKKCPNCDTEIPPNGKFCLECGHKF